MSVMSDQADVILLGMGTGGEELGGRLAMSGLDVVGIEPELVGGECAYWACIPSKMMIRAANLLQEARRVNGIAGHAEVIPDWLVDKFAIAGTIAECRAQVERLKKTGIQQIAIIPYGTPGGTREETLRGFAQAFHNVSAA
jgi:pyruvate/2-oxoglutarate dehydrogenase complex dihydrolipoamide dehydrogenase (E3) component